MCYFSLGITRALYRFTDPIRYVSSILLINIRYVSTVFSILSSNRSIQPTEIWDVEWSFPCVNFVVKAPHSPLPNQSLTWIVSLFHIRCKDCVIIMLITIKTLFYWANAYENGFLNVFSTGNLLNSRTLWQSRAWAKERKHTVYMSTQTLSTQFTAKDIDFLHFSSISCQKHIEMNIKWIRMAIPVLISMPVDLV